MQPVLEIYQEDRDYIVVLSKDISDLTDKYSRIKETKKFWLSEVKVLEEAIDTLVIEIMQDYGVIPTSDTNEAVESAFALLNRKYGIKVDIVDEYAIIPSNAKMVHRADRQTCIVEDDELSIANRITIKGYEL